MAIKDSDMSILKQKTIVLQGSFLGFFSFFSGVCPVLM